MISTLWATVSLLAALGAAQAQAQTSSSTYPTGPINLVIPLAAGDATDTSARAIIEELSRELKVAIVPVNRPGAAGALGTDLVGKAAKERHTLSLTTHTALLF